MPLLEIQPYEGLKNITEAIHNIFFVVALVIGAIWTLYTFSSLKSRESAKAKLFQQAVLDISITCQQEHVKEMDEDYILSTVKIINKGNRNTLLDFADPPLKLSRLYFREDSSVGVASTTKYKALTMTSVVLRSGAIIDIPFVAKIDAKGFYLIEFWVPLHKKEMGDHLSADGPNEETIYWAGFTTILVN